jgi:hypothetical protein
MGSPILSRRSRCRVGGGHGRPVSIHDRGYTLNQLRTDCDAYGTVESPYGDDVPGMPFVEGDSGVYVALVQALIDAKYPSRCAGTSSLAIDGGDGPLGHCGGLLRAEARRHPV